MINLLDGLRDLKAPLASGLTILFGLWLSLANIIDDVEPGKSIAGNIHRLSDFLGGPATLGLLAFAAYLLGLVLALDKLTIHYGGKWLKSRMDTSTIPFWTERDLSEYLLDCIKSANANGKSIIDIMKDVYPDPNLHYIGQTDRPNRPRKTPMYADAVMMEQELRQQILDNLELWAVDLQAAKDKLYDKYDKCKTESNFRAALVIPSFFVGLVVAIRAATEMPNAWSTVGYLAILLAIFIAMGRLLADAFASLRQANDTLLRSVILGQIEPGPLKKLKAESKKEEPALPESPNGLRTVLKLTVAKGRAAAQKTLSRFNLDQQAPLSPAEPGGTEP